MTPRRNQNTGSRLRNKARTANITADKSNVQIAVQCAAHITPGPNHLISGHRTAGSAFVTSLHFEGASRAIVRK